MFGSMVRTAREGKKLGLRAFARTLGISTTYLSHIETERTPPPAIERIVTIAELLGLSLFDCIEAAAMWPEYASYLAKTEPAYLAFTKNLCHDLEVLPKQ